MISRKLRRRSLRSLHSLREEARIPLPGNRFPPELGRRRRGPSCFRFFLLFAAWYLVLVPRSGGIALIYRLVLTALGALVGVWCVKGRWPLLVLVLGDISVTCVTLSGKRDNVQASGGCNFTYC